MRVTIASTAQAFPQAAITLVGADSGQGPPPRQVPWPWGKKGHLEVLQTTGVLWQGMAGPERRIWEGGKIDD